MLSDFGNWLVSLVHAAFTALWNFVADAFINLLDLLLTGVVAVFSSIPVPSFISGGLGSVWGGMDSGVLYVVTQCGVPACLAIIGAGYAFRLARKFFTLFQW